MSDSPNSDSTSVVEPAGGASADPFADFVNSQIDTSNITEENTGDEEDIDVVAPAGNSDHEQSDNVSFQPNLSDDKKNKEPIDDDDFFASLREAVNDESPLGESSDKEGNSNGIFKNFFDK